ncbi:MAG TPA: ATP-binding protein [Candidatus Diapherotrites archaeon]|uniref:ATP-binding protein n=1 Tax=Candidatus Iainarchaeum sp. TaxID=3101447 RepID=A0A7J4IZF3_9ARCH|nr:ATP-binding protein [Candidatus Diapherotrites archaeon]
MYIDIFKQIVVEWLEKPLPKLIKRDAELRVEKETINAIIGPRRVGKTSLMFLTIQELLVRVKKEEILFIDFEDNRLSGISSRELDELFVAHREVTGIEPKYLFFDEVQQAPEWSRFVRRLHNSGKYHIVVSGSSSRLLGREIATELRGRYRSLLMLPFSFDEFLRFRGFEYDKKMEFSEKRGALLKLLEEYLTYGGFPLVAGKNDFNDKKELVKSYYETIFYKDIVERYKVKSVDIMEAIISNILDNNSCLFSVTSFEKTLKEKGIKASKKTISLYIKYLEDAFFVFSSQKFSYSAKVRILNPKKIYLLDNSFQIFLSSNFSPDRGKLLEAMVMQELKRRELQTFYFKDKKECDFIVKNGAQMEAVQVTYELSQKNMQRETTGLLEAMEKTKTKKGSIITFDQAQEINFEGVKIQAKQAWKWLLENSSE